MGCWDDGWIGMVLGFAWCSWEFRWFQMISAIFTMKIYETILHGSLNVPIEHHPTIRYMVYNGYYKVMSNIPKMGQLPTPVLKPNMKPWNKPTSSPTRWKLRCPRPTLMQFPLLETLPRHQRLRGVLHDWLTGCCSVSKMDLFPPS